MDSDPKIIEYFQGILQQLNNIDTQLNIPGKHTCENSAEIAVFNRVIGTEIPEMKGDIRTLDDKISGIETSVEIIKTKVLNGSLRGIKPLQFWSTLGGIILTFGTIILWIMGQLK